MAWHTAALGRYSGDRFPDLYELTGDNPPDPEDPDVAERSYQATLAWNRHFAALSPAPQSAPRSAPEQEPNP